MPNASPSSMMIYIAGPYRSGTGDDPEKMAANVKALEALALPIFRAGHVPVLGEWFSLPLVQQAGSRRVGDEVFGEIFYPVSQRLIARCDAVLRGSGTSEAADQMMALAQKKGLAVYYRLQDIPGCEEATG